eukprot:2114911-Pyramimonas_sp.AAC.1
MTDLSDTWQPEGGKYVIKVGRYTPYAAFFPVSSHPMFTVFTLSLPYIIRGGRGSASERGVCSAPVGGSASIFSRAPP